ncbi:MAG TPA: gliding motility-associated C-terminal domain-containing protein [Chryseolinea sp.]
MLPKDVRCLLIVCLLCLLRIETSAKCDDWANLQMFEDVFVRDVQLDRFGNLYAVGSFFNPDFTIGSISIPYLGGHTIFVLKFDKNLSLVWGKSFGTGGNCGATQVEVDHDDNILVAGHYSGGPLNLDCIQIANSGGFDTFVAKLFPDGTVQWATHSTGTNDEQPTGLVITKSNSVIVVGHFVEGSGSFEGVTVQSFGGLDSFIVKLSTTGKVEWASSIGGSGGNLPDYILDVDIDLDDNVLITGMFESEKLFIGQQTIDRKTISENYFVAKLNSLGQSLWAKTTGLNVDASGWSVKVGTDNNIYVLGRFYAGTIAVDGFSLTSSGDADAMLIKYSGDGHVLAAINFGGDEFDSGATLDVDPFGNLVAVGYYYSTSFHVGSFTETKFDSSSDAFVIRFDTDLAALCFSRISGSGEAHVWTADIDLAGNIWLVVDNALGVGELLFDTQYAVGSLVDTMIISLGDRDDFDSGSPTYAFDVELGDGQDLCSGEDVILDAGQWCNPLITWQDGSHDRFYHVVDPGEYWVEVTVNGLTGRDTVTFLAPFPQTIDLGKDTTLCVGQSILLDAGDHCGTTYEWQNGSTSSTFSVTQPGTYTVIISDGTKVISDAVNVSYYPLPEVNLGVDKLICDGDLIAFNVTQSLPSKYLWSDGTAFPTFTVSEEGVFWVKVETKCQIEYDSITLSKPGPLVVDLGKDRTICAGNNVVIGSEVPNAVSYLWQDGTVEPTLNVTRSGSFNVVISNGCDQTTDSVRVTLVDQNNLLLPNVITPNEDDANDVFVVPELLIGSQLQIYNRWGEAIFYSPSYQNTWAGEGLSAGVYYYTLHGICPVPIKATIHLLKN